MAYTTYWVEEPWLIAFKLSSTADYVPSMREIVNMLDTIDGHLYVISDISALANVGSLKAFASGELFQLGNRILKHPNLGHWATAHPGTFMRFIASVLAQKNAPKSGDANAEALPDGRGKSTIVGTFADAENICRRLADVDPLRRVASNTISIGQ